MKHAKRLACPWTKKNKYFKWPVVTEQTNGHNIKSDPLGGFIIMDLSYI